MKIDNLDKVASAFPHLSRTGHRITQETLLSDARSSV